MKNQIWFKTTLGFEATRERLRQARTVIGDMQAYEGRLTFILREFKDVTFQITTHSKLSITYPEETNYQVFLEHIRPFLVKADGSPAEIVDEKKTLQKKKKSKEKKFWLFEWWERRTERKQLERWEERLAILQMVRPQLRLRVESDGNRFLGHMLDEVNEEIDMLKNLIMAGKK